MGGIRWVPKEWNNEYIIHESLEGAQKLYPVKFVDDPSCNFVKQAMLAS